MKGRLCGLLLACSTMLMSLFVVSSDVNALRYGIDGIPLYRNNIYYCNGPDGACNGRTWHNTESFTVFLDSDSRISFDEDLGDPDLARFRVCDTVNPLRYIFNTGFTSSRNQAYLNSSQTFVKQPFSNLYPASYPSCLGDKAEEWPYDQLVMGKYNLLSGDTEQILNFNHFLFDSGDDGYMSGKLKYLQIPFDISNIESLPANEPVEFEFALVTDSANGFPYFDPNTKAELSVSYFSDNGSNSSYDDFYNSYSVILPDSGSPRTSCSIEGLDSIYRFEINNDEGLKQYVGVNFVCSFTPTEVMYFPSATLEIYGSSGPSYNSSVFLEYDYHDLYFATPQIITNNDSTWSGIVANPTITGEALENNPSYLQIYGYPEPDSTCADGDWFCGLSNLFDFSVLNPFSGLFGLFSDQSSCASIPTFASMLHSNETTVCPWFDSNTRNIVTPVLGLASMMLIFGFTVRWLGARSGNFIEDSGGVDSGGYHFENKYRRKK